MRIEKAAARSCWRVSRVNYVLERVSPPVFIVPLKPNRFGSIGVLLVSGFENQN